MGWMDIDVFCCGCRKQLLLLVLWIHASFFSKMLEIIMQPNNRCVPTDMMLHFLCSKPHWHHRQQLEVAIFNFQRQDTATQDADGAGAVWTSVQLAVVEGVRKNEKTIDLDRTRIVSLLHQGITSLSLSLSWSLLPVVLVF
jgi:hypothetical protein